MAWVAAEYRSLPQQVIHGDYGPGNTLADTGQLTAILDFEMALPDARAMDVAAGLTFSMRPWENPRPLEMAAVFLQGYREWVQLTPAEVAALPWLMRLRNAVSVLWRLGQGLTTGDATPGLQRIEEARWFSQWLHHHLTAQTLSNLMRP
jgi:Ser/Thr protein kinase RdoA (MazF antagonist)